MLTRVLMGRGGLVLVDDAPADVGRLGAREISGRWEIGLSDGHGWLAARWLSLQARNQQVEQLGVELPLLKGADELPHGAARGIV